MLPKFSLKQKTAQAFSLSGKKVRKVWIAWSDPSEQGEPQMDFDRISPRYHRWGPIPLSDRMRLSTHNIASSVGLVSVIVCRLVVT